MRYSQLLTQTLRELPADAEAISHQLALRAGLIRPLASGIFSFLPLGLRVKRNIEQILREEMEHADCFEISMPVVQPAEIWRESGRWDDVGQEMMRVKDRADRDMCLAMTHEEAVTDLARHMVQSYRQLPLSAFQLQTKFRDEPRSRGGLIRVREFTMKDGYSFHINQAGLDAYYPRMYEAYQRIFERAGLGDDVIAVESDPGMMGGTEAHEFMYLNPGGEDTLLLCDTCGYQANRQVAIYKREAIEAESEKPLQKVATPNCKTIEEVASFLDVPQSKTAKAVFLIGTINGEDKFIFAVLRGDHELNETKLANVVKAQALRPATDEEITAVGAVPGYASPMAVKNAIVVADKAIAKGTNFVSGANEEGYHCLNVNVGRDFDPDIVTDLIAVEKGMPCPECETPLNSTRGIEVGNIFKLGTKYSDSMGAKVLDENGKMQPLVMGCYGIGVGRLLACIIEAHHDDHGIIWPISVAPFEVQIVVLTGRKPAGELEAAEKLYGQLKAAGLDVLLDDRDERAGVKFNDADLIGIPIRLTVGSRGLANGQVEMKLRHENDRSDVPLDQVIERVKCEVKKLKTNN
ncbi:MAG: proline--tRNA ligase [Candidatus Latescibacteria bacterium]|nr:proline--tRNA ligase [Candidatus Latescibacterota bacterium]